MRGGFGRPFFVEGCALMKLTVKQAVRAGWANRSAIFANIYKGQISAEKNAQGVVLIELSELGRAFPVPVLPDDAEPWHGDDIEVERLRCENARLRAVLEAAEADRDRLKEMAWLAAALRRPLWRWLNARRESDPKSPIVTPWHGRAEPVNVVLRSVHPGCPLVGPPAEYQSHQGIRGSFRVPANRQEPSSQPPLCGRERKRPGASGTGVTTGLKRRANDMTKYRHLATLLSG